MALSGSELLASSWSVLSCKHAVSNQYLNEKSIYKIKITSNPARQNVSSITFFDDFSMASLFTCVNTRYSFCMYHVHDSEQIAVHLRY